MALWDIMNVDFGGILSSITGVRSVQQMIMEQLMKPINTMITNVLAGKWKGKGAQAFVSELQQMTMPGFQKQSDNLNRFADNIHKAQQIMQEAVQQSNSLAKQMGGLWDSI